MRIVRNKNLEDRSGVEPRGGGRRRRDAATHAHQSVMFEDDFLAYPQPKAGSRHFLGGKEGLEDMRAHIRLHARAGVGNDEPYAGLLRIVPVTRAPSANHQPASAATGINEIARASFAVW